MTCRALAIAPLAAALCLANSLCATAQPVQWSGNDHWYEAVYVPTCISWSAARDAAESAGGYLATVTSEQENAFVYGLVDEEMFWHFKDNNNGPWLGAYQDHSSPDYSEPGDGWRWVTGEGFDYTNWAAVQPDNGGSSGEDCLHFWGSPEDGRTSNWNDAPDAEPIYGYVVEYDVIPEPASALPVLTGFSMLAAACWRKQHQFKA